jgi:RNA polymerase sigma-70 factor, ECF subfamily
LRGQAIRLARALVELLPNQPEAAGLLALLLLSESRVPARTAKGALVLLRDQDRTRWDRTMIAEGHAIVRACIRRGQPGPFQLQAAIQAVHCHAESFEATDWPQIVRLYEHLFSVMPTPVVALNRAIAIAEVEGPGAALTTLDAIAADLDNYHLMHAARGTMLRRLGQRDAAQAAFESAAKLAATEAERRFLARQIQELAEADRPCGDPLPPMSAYQPDQPPRSSARTPMGMQARHESVPDTQRQRGVDHRGRQDPGADRSAGSGGPDWTSEEALDE